MQAILGAEETLNWETSVDSLGDLGQITSGLHPGTGRKGCESPSGLPACGSRKTLYSSSPLCLFEVAAGMLKTGRKARNKGSFCQSRKLERVRVRGRQPWQSLGSPKYTVQRPKGTRPLLQDFLGSTMAFPSSVCLTIWIEGAKTQSSVHKVKLKICPKGLWGLAPAPSQTLGEADLSGTSEHWPVTGLWECSSTEHLCWNVSLLLNSSCC